MEYLAIVPILALLMIAHELGHFVVARRSGIVVEEFAIGFPPRLFSVVRGGVRYSLNLIPIGAYVRMLGEEDPRAPGSFAGQSRRVRAAVLVAGAAMNLVVAIVAFTTAYATGWPRTISADIQIAAVMPDTPAEAGGLRAGDVVRQVDGRDVRTLDEFRVETERHLGQPMELAVDRTGTPTTITVTPRTEWPEGQGPTGIRLQVADAVVTPVPYPPLQALALGLQQAFAVLLLPLGAVVMAIRGDLAVELLRPVGLPGMTQLAAGAASVGIETGWWFPVLTLTGAFSASLALVNLLPLPALDGGRLLFVLIEAIRGRRVPPEREGLIHFVGMAVLLSLMLLVSFNDVVSPLPDIDWGGR